MIRYAKMTTFTVVIILAFVASPLMGQVSNTNLATAGFFFNDVDNYMDYHRYSGVEFDKWFGYAAWNWNYSLDLGYATRKGSTYLGFFYNGDGIYSDRVKGELVDSVYFFSDGSLDYTDYDAEFWNRALYSDNGITALIGIAGMGIKVGFRLEIETYDQPELNFSEKVTGDKIDYTSHIDSFTGHNNHYIPVIGWGMGFMSDSKTIKPYVEVSLNFGSARNEVIYSDYTTDYGVISLDRKSYATGSAGMDGYGYAELLIPGIGFVTMPRPIAVPGFSPNIKAGVKLDLGRMELGFEYDLGLDVYSANSYGAFGITGDVRGIANWIGYRTDDVGLYSTRIDEYMDVNLSERFASNHTITPSLRYDWELSDRVKLGVSVKLPFYIYSERNDNYRFMTSTVDYQVPTDSQLNWTSIQVEKYCEGLEEISTFSINPSVSVGTQFAAIPDRFTLNAGVSLWPISYRKFTRTISPNGYYTKTYKEYNSSGDLVDDNVYADLNTKTVDYRHEEISWGQVSANVSAGFTLNFSSKFALDTEFSIYAGDFDVDLTQVNVLFTIKK